MGGGDASDGTAGETDGQVADVGSGGKSGAGGSAGSSGTAGAAGAAGAGGKGGAAGAGGTRDDAAADAAVADIGLDVTSETGDDALDAPSNKGKRSMLRRRMTPWRRGSTRSTWDRRAT
jgi:hypothetical protein